MDEEEDLWWEMETGLDTEEAFGRRDHDGGGGSAFLGSREERRLARTAAALAEVYLTQQCEEMRPVWDVSVSRALATGSSAHAIASSDDPLSRLALRRQQSHRVVLSARTAGPPLPARAIPSISVRELPEEILRGAAEAVRRAKAELAQKRAPGDEGSERRGKTPPSWVTARPSHPTARTLDDQFADRSLRCCTLVAVQTLQGASPGVKRLVGRGSSNGAGRGTGLRKLPPPVPHWGSL
jgi:hypothetical protein